MCSSDLNLQIYFLNKRLQGIVDIRNSQLDVIQDRTIYEDARIFAPNLHAMGLLSTRDYENYKSLFELMISLVKPPDLLIYLKASIPTLVYQINKRGREYESGIRVDYLEGLNERYEDWVANYTDGKKLILNVDELKFEDNPQDLQKVIELIEKEIRK